MGLIASGNWVTAANLSTTATPLALPISNAAQFGFRAPARNAIGASGGVWTWSVDVDLGSARVPKLMALLGSNLQGYSVAQTVYGAATLGGTTYSRSYTHVVKDAGHMFMPIASVTAYRYWRYQIVLVATFPAFIDIGRVWISSGFETDWRYDWIPGRQFGTQLQESPLGRVQRTSGRMRRELTLGIDAMTFTQALGDSDAVAGDDLDYFLQLAGQNGELIAMPFTDNVLKTRDNAVYGHLVDSGVEIPRQVGGYHNARVKVREIPP